MANVQRRLEFVHLADAPAVAPDGSWFMAAIVRPGDDLAALSGWARDKESARPLPSPISPISTRTPTAPSWLPGRRQAPDGPGDDGFRSWGPLHKVMGLGLNRQVCEDHV